MEPPILVRDYSSIFVDLNQWNRISSTLDKVLMAKNVISVALVLSAGGPVF